jgi:hypothetical protein
MMDVAHNIAPPERALLVLEANQQEDYISFFFTKE